MRIPSPGLARPVYKVGARPTAHPGEVVDGSGVARHEAVGVVHLSEELKSPRFANKLCVNLVRAAHHHALGLGLERGREGGVEGRPGGEEGAAARRGGRGRRVQQRGAAYF